MAASDEMLEDEFASGSVQLVGTHGMEVRCHWVVALQTATHQRTQFHLAAADVFGHFVGEANGENGEDLRWETPQDQDPQGAHSLPPG